MIDGGGLGLYKPEEIGPTSVQAPNGVVDIVVDDEEAAVRAAKQYLSYFQGTLPEGKWEAPEQRVLRQRVRQIIICFYQNPFLRPT